MITKENCIKWFNLASKSEINEGKVWYHQAHNYAVSLSNEFSQPIEIVCAIIAVLSPRCKWEVNVIAARQVLQGVYPSGAVLGLSVKKAFSILETGDIDSYLKGPKVRSFYANILDPLSCDYVTIDTWAAKAANPEFTGNVNERNYDAYKAVYIEAALSLGLRPLEFQAIVWVSIRNRESLGSQLRLF